MSKPKLNEKPLPPTFRHLLKVDWMRKFSLRERFKILFGYSIVVAVRIPTQNSPGQIQPVIAGEISREIDPDSVMMRQMANMLVEKKDLGGKK